MECTLSTSGPDVDSILGLKAFDLDRILDLNADFLPVVSQDWNSLSPSARHRHCLVETGVWLCQHCKSGMHRQRLC